MDITTFLHKVNDLILNPIILLMFALAVVYFVYGIVKFVSLQPGDKERDDARKSIIWGIIGMVIMFSVFGLIRFVLDTFGVTPEDTVGPYIGL